MKKTAQLWGGRFGDAAGKTNPDLVRLNCSLPYDARLYADDIDGSKAYAEALKRAGYLSAAECASIVTGFELVRYDWIEGLVRFLPTDEDVHTVNERLLGGIVGTATAHRLHTGRSRNDQVVTDLKLWLRKGIRETVASLCAVIEAARTQAERSLEVLMPGYTHLQRAQPVLASHWLLSHAYALREDCLRLKDLRARSNVLPLGSGALAGNPLGIDREWLAARLDFAAATPNSMHAVGDRDFVVDFVYCCSLAGVHLSRLAEDLILYSTKEFDFVEIDATYCTGSSLMPQKRNPDSLELVRGISASICACLTGIMMTLKGTPSTYNKDLQFDKQYCFEAFDKLQQALSITAGVLQTLTIKSHNCASALTPDMLATDWTYYLVRKGVPFREAHHYVGQVVSYAEQSSAELTEITLEKLQSICPHFDWDVMKCSDFQANVEQYDLLGGTSSTSVKRQLKHLHAFLIDANKE